jgi:hypothetical protein
MTLRPTTTIRLTDEDREILTDLQAMTGLDSFAAVIRFCIREELSRRRKKR